jgi:hypothetical protein
MELRDQIMKILNGRSGFLNSDLNKQIGKLEAERHRNLINIVDKLWDEKGLHGRNSKNI